LSAFYLLLLDCLLEVSHHTWTHWSGASPPGLCVINNNLPCFVDISKQQALDKVL